MIKDLIVGILALSSGLCLISLIGMAAFFAIVLAIGKIADH